jgi:hypothetical protein
MWMFSKEGFFSVVKDEYCEADELMVRSRWKQDLICLSERIGSKAEIIVIKHADYRYRLKVKREDWVGYCTKAASEIDYSNVKGTIAHGDRERSRAYMGCWHSLYQAQEEPTRKRD